MKLIIAAITKTPMTNCLIPSMISLTHENVDYTGKKPDGNYGKINSKNL